MKSPATDKVPEIACPSIVIFRGERLIRLIKFRLPCGTSDCGSASLPLLQFFIAQLKFESYITTASTLSPVLPNSHTLWLLQPRILRTPIAKTLIAQTIRAVLHNHNDSNPLPQTSHSTSFFRNWTGRLIHHNAPQYRQDEIILDRGCAIRSQRLSLDRIAAFRDRCCDSREWLFGRDICLLAAQSMTRPAPASKITR